MYLFSKKSSIKHNVALSQAVRGGNTSKCSGWSQSYAINTTKMEKYVNHIYSTSQAKPINCPCVQFAVFFVSDSGKERHFL